MVKVGFLSCLSVNHVVIVSESAQEFVTLGYLTPMPPRRR